MCVTDEEHLATTHAAREAATAARAELTQLKDEKTLLELSARKQRDLLAVEVVRHPRHTAVTTTTTVITPCILTSSATSCSSPSW